MTTSEFIKQAARGDQLVKLISRLDAHSSIKPSLTSTVLGNISQKIYPHLSGLGGLGLNEESLGMAISRIQKPNIRIWEQLKSTVPVSDKFDPGPEFMEVVRRGHGHAKNMDYLTKLRSQGK